MADSREQHVCIKFCGNFGTLKVTFGQQIVGRTQFLGGYLKKWYDILKMMNAQEVCQ
jgi:hypothetical protein